MSLVDDPFADLVKYDGACQICHGDMRKCNGHCWDRFDNMFGKVRNPMETRAKFTCTSKRQYPGWNGHEFLWEYEFQAVTGKSTENETFFASTPSGSVKLSAVRDDLFVPGKSYYLDFSPAEG